MKNTSKDNQIPPKHQLSKKNNQQTVKKPNPSTYKTKPTDMKALKKNFGKTKKLKPINEFDAIDAEILKNFPGETLNDKRLAFMDLNEQSRKDMKAVLPDVLSFKEELDNNK